MLKLKRMYIVEDAHKDYLKKILKLYSKDPDNWDKEWSVNPNYMVDLKHYGAGNCMCGHAIRYQFQFINNKTMKTLPVGSVCVHQLGLPRYDAVLDKLERLNSMAIVELDTDLPTDAFLKKYKKDFSKSDLDSLLYYDNTALRPTDITYYKDHASKRTLSDGGKQHLKDIIISMHEKAKKIVDNIEDNSTPVTKSQVTRWSKEVEDEMERFANAKQGTLWGLLS